MTVYTSVNNFVTGDLSSFYLDIAKDVVYIEAADHPHRRAMQTVMYDTLIALLKLMSPIIPHTTDEMWGYLAHEEAESVQLTDMPDARAETDEDIALMARFSELMEVRDDVLKALEEARNGKVIGKSLEAAVTVYVPEDLKVLLTSEDIDFAQFFIVSGFRIGGNLENSPADATGSRVRVVVEKAKGEKCARCWSVPGTVGENPEHPELCARCADVVINHYEA